MSRFRHFLAASLAITALAILPKPEPEEPEDADRRLVELEARADVHIGHIKNLLVVVASLRERCIDLAGSDKDMRARLDRLEALVEPPPPAPAEAKVIPFPQKPQEAEASSGHATAHG